MKRRRIDHPEQGAAAVEFALILPLLSALLFGIIEFSILFYNKAMITNASREGARSGIVYNFPDRPSDADISSVVTTYCGSHLITFGDPAQVPSITVARGGTGTGADLSVTVDYEYDFLLLPNLLGSFFSGSSIGNQITLEATTVMRLE
jgi:Flp pilus assembly protein TadG